jgi:hypothetical protein
MLLFSSYLKRMGGGIERSVISGEEVAEATSSRDVWCGAVCGVDTAIADIA